MNTDYGGGYWIALALFALGAGFFLLGVLLLELLKGLFNFSKKNVRSILLFSCAPLFAIVILGPVVIAYLLLEPYHLGTVAFAAVNMFICLPISLALVVLITKMFDVVERRLLSRLSSTENQLK